MDTWARGRHLVNAYGPSENTVVSTWAELDGRELSRLSSFIIEVEGGADDIDRRSSLSEGRERATQHVPIGRPVMGVQCYVFEATRCKALQPIGAPGELCLGGDQLARGYYRDPVRTAEKFVPNPLNGKRMYKTGDLVMWLPSSELLYLGRNDEMAAWNAFKRVAPVFHSGVPKDSVLAW